MKLEIKLLSFEYMLLFDIHDSVMCIVTYQILLERRYSNLHKSMSLDEFHFDEAFESAVPPLT